MQSSFNYVEAPRGHTGEVRINLEISLLTVYLWI